MYEQQTCGRLLQNTLQYFIQLAQLLIKTRLNMFRYGRFDNAIDFALFFVIASQRKNSVQLDDNFLLTIY